MEKTIEQKVAIGEKIAEVFGLKQARNDNGKRYSPARYDSAWGNKTSLGLFETVARIMQSDELKGE